MVEEGIKVHTKGRVQHGASTDIDGDYFFFKGGSTGVIKILEPMNPLLNYYEYVIVNKGQEASIGIGVREHLGGNCTCHSHMHTLHPHTSHSTLTHHIPPSHITLYPHTSHSILTHHTPPLLTYL